MSSKDRKLLIKFENKSNRVKGLAFHPTRPWILASLHNGVIQLWDYRMEVLIDKFEEHDGPVRGIHFHISQPLFVSGGDDYKIKVWNYSLRRCLFNLIGHLDYIRTVRFHHEYPWILSASDDQTIRIWNWQNRTCLSVLTGHNHYVMCAQFHPKEDLVLSASLDQTVRVWDVSGLRKKTVSIASDYLQSQSQNNAQSDLFGSADVIVKHVLEGHTRGVNWASFHKSLGLIVSGADDREVKLWRMQGDKAYELDTLRGHINNVSCVMFHPKKDIIISNSEDKTIRIWDMSKQMNPITLRRDSDRYWILDAHPTLNLMAAGHDSGLLVFKLARERPPYDASGAKACYYAKDQYLYEYNFKTGKEKPILATRKRQTQTNSILTGSTNSTGIGQLYRSLQYNSANKTQHTFLLTSESDSSYELYAFAKPKDDDSGAVSSRGKTRADDEDAPTALRGSGKCAVFVSRSRFAVLDKSRTLYLKTLKNEVKRKITVPNVSVNYIFPGGIGRLILRSSELIMLYDIQSLKVIAELSTQSRHPIKYVYWSKDYTLVALVSKANIYICDSQLTELCTMNENTRIKSGVWDTINKGVFLYTTSTHLKYVLTNGESGIIRTLSFPIYLTGTTANSVSYIDRELKTGVLTMDPTEYLFKLALQKRRNREVLKMMQSKKLVGSSILSYLHKKGFPEIALHFVDDLHIKFDLALECGNINVALECAQKLDLDEKWHKLGIEALRQGNFQVVEQAYQRTKNFERLSFLYLMAGQTPKLEKMLHIASLRNDPQGRFHNALYLGNVHERINVLRESGQLKLAYTTAMAHGCEEIASALQEELGENVPDLPDLSNSKLLQPPTPILRETNWPLLEVRKGFFEQLDAEPIVDAEAEVRVYQDSGDDADEEERHDNVMSWGVEEDKKKMKAVEKSDLSDAATAWGGDLDVDLPPVETDETESARQADGDYFVMPLSGQNLLADKWANSSVAADLVACGQFDQAMHLLHRQAGIVNFEPLKSHFLAIYSSSQAHLALSDGHSIRIPLKRTVENQSSDWPNICFKLSSQLDCLKTAYKQVTDGKFSAALADFLQVLQTIPLMVISRSSEKPEINEILRNCREYVTAMKVEAFKRESAANDPIRQALLSCLFTTCQLQIVHSALGLRSAISACYKVKNFTLTAMFCRRLLELCSGGNSVVLEKIINIKQIRGVLQLAEKSSTDECTIDFPSDNSPIQICCKSFTVIPKNSQLLKCPYCQSTFKQQFDDYLCNICELGKIGAQATGISNYATI